MSRAGARRPVRTLLAFVREADLGPLIRHMLEACNWEVVVAASEAEAEELARTTELDLLLLEVTPALSGRSTVERLRARTPGLPILYLSACTTIPNSPSSKGNDCSHSRSPVTN